MNVYYFFSIFLFVFLHTLQPQTILSNSLRLQKDSFSHSHQLNYKKDNNVTDFFKRILLEPEDVSAAKWHSLLIFIPGGKVDVEFYRKTALAIQKKHNHHNDNKLWVVLPSCLFNLCIPGLPTTAMAIRLALEAANRKLDKFQTKFQHVFISGHSLGATAARSYVDKNKESKFTGSILFGTQYMDQAKNNIIPQLIVVGELDSISFTQLTPLYKDFLEEKDRKKAFSNSSVIVLPNINHSDFCPGFFVPGDLRSELTAEKATDEIAKITSSWIQYMSGSEKVLKESYNKLKFFALETDKLFSGPLVINKVSQPTNWCKVVQKTLTGINSKLVDDYIIVNAVEVHNTLMLMHVHPKYKLINVQKHPQLMLSEVASYSTFSNGDYPFTQNTYANQIACKSISSARVSQQLQINTNQTIGCKELNRLAFDTAFTMLSSSSRKRFVDSGASVTFKDDYSTFGNVGPIWVFANYVVETLSKINNKNVLEVQSPRLFTSINGTLYPGSSYCKVVSPERLLAWMLTDALKIK